MLFLGRQLRTRLDLLIPQVTEKVTFKQAAQKLQHDRRAKARDLQIGQQVMARNFRPGPSYVPGEVVAKCGPLSCSVRVGDGMVWRRHVDHLKLFESKSAVEPDQVKPEPVEEEDSGSYPKSQSLPSDIQ